MINNEFYNELGTDWLDRFDHPIALLRAENAVRAPWIASELQQRLGRLGKNPSFLDVGCGAGLLTNYLSKLGIPTSGIDLSESSLQVARQTDVTAKVDYRVANAYSLPYETASFNAVSALDILEHVEEPHLLIAEASRVLKPGGLFFFHTFNRNFLSYLLVIKGVDWFIRNAPKNMHVYPLFIKPKELEEQLNFHNLKAVCWRGLAPNIFRSSSLKMVFTRKVPADFSFRFCKSLKIGYCGIAIKG
jgi:2-polyprenyl-6-hydroxyphenyl methylase/3-demethylubiquinone-9 3-methyltransferase